MSITTAVLASIGAVLVLVGVLKKPPRIPLKRRELDALCDARAQYLPQLQMKFEEYINRVEYLAKYSKELYNPESYQVYSRFYRNILIYFNNTIFRQIEAADTGLFSITQQIDTYNAMVKDKRVKDFANGLTNACHMTYSYVIATQLRCIENRRVPIYLQFWFFISRKMQERWRRNHNKVNIVIQDLLEGAEDEL